jgi:hypothetical protein
MSPPPCARPRLEPVRHLHHARAGGPADAHPRRRCRRLEVDPGHRRPAPDPLHRIGQLVRPLVAKWVEKHKALVGYVDRGSILLVVYAAFSEAVVGGIWRKVSVLEMVVLLAACCVLLAIVLAATAYGARALGFSKEDEITIVFCGSKKSMATGVPMAGILFPGPTAGIIVLPLMIFHQIQLMACSVIAQRYAKRAEWLKGFRRFPFRRPCSRTRP